MSKTLQVQCCIFNYTVIFLRTNQLVSIIKFSFLNSDYLQVSLYFLKSDSYFCMLSENFIILGPKSSSSSSSKRYYIQGWLIVQVQLMITTHCMFDLLLVHHTGERLNRAPRCDRFNYGHEMKPKNYPQDSCQLRRLDFVVLLIALHQNGITDTINEGPREDTTMTTVTQGNLRTQH